MLAREPKRPRHGEARRRFETNRELAARFLAGASLQFLATEERSTVDHISRRLRSFVESPAAVEYARLQAQPPINVNGTVRIFSPRGWRAKIDAADFHWITGLVWTPNDQGYLRNPATRRRLHVVLMNPPRERLVDHRNGDTFDNRRENLRVTDKSGNCRNMRSTARTRRGQHKGVTTNFQGGNLRYLAQITVGKRADGRERRITGPLRHTESEAARDYDLLALEHFGEFAATNFPRSAYDGKTALGQK